MIDERELRALGHPGAEPAAHPPVEAVLARGARLRRRRHVVRAMGATAAIAGLIGSALVLEGRTGGGPDIEASEDPTTTASEQPSAPPPPPPDCEINRSVPGERIGTGDLDQFISPEPVAASDVPDELRVLPTFVPGDPPITDAAGARYTNPCPDTAPYPADPALELRTDSEDPTAGSRIRVDGPLPRPAIDPADEDGEATELRGQPATFGRPDGAVAAAMFAWTEPDGWSWSITGLGVDDATVRAVAEDLVLDSSPEGDEPTAALAPEQVPGGFQIIWQTHGTPTPVPAQTTDWNVSFGTTGPGEAGVRCELTVGPRLGDMPLGDSAEVAGDVVSVGGQDALWHSGDPALLALGGLTWMVTPDAVATMGCIEQHAGGPEPIGVDTMVQVAETVAPVVAADPRLPG